MPNAEKFQISKLKLNRKNSVLALSIILSLLFSLQLHAQTPPNKAKWYRYYDKNGVANISTSVTPEHIKAGYEALDQNMQEIQKAKAYNVDLDLSNSAARATKAKQQEQDNKLKRAYSSSKIAISKRDDKLKNINQQINFQKQQLQQLQQDRVLFQRQQQVHIKKGNAVPQTILDRLTNNAKNMTDIQKNIESLQTNYRNTQSQYDNIIKRLKTLE